MVTGLEVLFAGYAVGIATAAIHQCWMDVNAEWEHKSRYACKGQTCKVPFPYESQLNVKTLRAAAKSLCVFGYSKDNKATLYIRVALAWYHGG